MTKRIKPIYGTTLAGTEQILDKWLNDKKEEAIGILMATTYVNKHGEEISKQKAKETIEKYIEDNF